MIGVMPLHAPTPLHRGEGTRLVVILAGPTASGKSALALALAEDLGGTVINADSLQCYRDLSILTARPDPAAEARAPHRLYGFLDADDPGSAGRWRAAALAEIGAATAARRLPIVVGGSGLYLRALTRGLAPIPEIPDWVRQEARALFAAVGGGPFRLRLERLDRAAAERLAPGDSQRLLRAYEVVRATGRPIGWWREQRHDVPTGRFATILLMPPRAALYAAVNARFAAMIDKGGLDEAAALLSRRLDPGLPVMKAAGLPELFAHLRGAIGLGEAIAAGQRATRRYAKRQMTWFCHQSQPDLIVAEQFSERIMPIMRQFINNALLTGRA
jgi:tRNA dimethylallyltransferase